jgi:prolipoprotein diacylglyceryltransferase
MIFFSYMSLYSIVRFISELHREEYTETILSMRAPQFSSIILLIASLTFIYVTVRKNQKV